MEKMSGSVRLAVAAIRKAKRVIIVAHVNPDGDTIGCQLALGLALLNMEKKVTLLSQDGVPTRFQFLPGSELVQSQSAEPADVAIAVDCGSAQQLGSVQGIFFKCRTTIQIDHHDFGDSFGKIQVLEEAASAVGEIVYELIRALKVEITPQIAACLLTSIIVDTGAFRFSNIRPKTFDICSKLIRTGVDLQHLIEESYWKKTRSMSKLSGHCSLHTHYSSEGMLAWATVYQKDFKKFGAKLSDVDAVADELRSIEGVKIAAVFRETEGGRFRVSLRSKNGINVAIVAKRFGGGGHHNSAGCSIRSSEAEKQKLLTELNVLLS
ncbi:MAG TPA: bifunctional oligoribonuclease/PAP phosphatase NrnA [Candidatus Eisenbacteria bacterium]|nr:bifunctional oligoribonuclease/PAP phosphatase NrnA [Candidatus Eisenbacteria bacterium]